MSYERIMNSDAIIKCLYQFDDCYPRLLNRVKDIDAFAKKLVDNGVVVIYKDADIVKGVICFYNNDPVNWIGYITIIWINKDSRRGGIGTKLLYFCINEMKKAGMKSVRLEVKKENTKAISFYEKNGFIIQNSNTNDSFYMIRKI